MQNRSFSRTTLGKLVLAADRVLGAVLRSEEPQPVAELVSFFEARDADQLKQTLARSLEVLRALRLELADLEYSFGYDNEDEMLERLQDAIGTATCVHSILKHGVPNRYRSGCCEGVQLMEAVAQQLSAFQHIMLDLEAALDWQADREQLFATAGSHLNAAIGAVDVAWFKEEFGQRVSEPEVSLS